MIPVKKDGGPAFPVPGCEETKQGMTLRDFFAAMALIARMSRVDLEPELAEEMADICYYVADRMLNARENKED